MTATYGMTNVKIQKEETGWHLTSYLVYADTERWGRHQIMAQFATREEAYRWCKENGVLFELPTARERVEQEIARGFSRVQIGNVMYRRLYIENGRIIGHSNGYHGWRDITDMINECKMISENIGKTKEKHGLSGKYSNRTVKFGNACAW